MAARRRTTVKEAAAVLAAAAAEDLAALPAEDLEAAEISEDVLEGLRRLDQGGNRVTWYVYSDTPGTSGDSEGYVEKLRTEHLDEQRFKTRYGPGEFRVLGRTSDGHYVKGSHKVIKISDIGAERPGSRGAAETDAVALMRELRAADDARQKARDDNLKTYATILAAPLATLGAALIGRRPAIDIAALVTALRPTQSAPTLTEMTTALVNLKAVQGDSGGGQVDMLLKVLDRLQDLPQGAAGEGGWLGFLRDIVKEAAPHARELIGRMQQQPGQAAQPAGQAALPRPQPMLPPRPAPAPGAAAVPGAAPVPGATPGNGATAPMPTASVPSSTAFSAPVLTDPTPTGLTAEGVDMWAVAQPWLRRRAEDLQEWASANMDVELCAEMLVASVPKVFRALITAADLMAYLQREDWWIQLTNFHPPLAPYHAWIDDVRQDVLQLLMDELSGTAGTPEAPEQGTTQ